MNMYIIGFKDTRKKNLRIKILNTKLRRLKGRCWGQIVWAANVRVIPGISSLPPIHYSDKGQRDKKANRHRSPSKSAKRTGGLRFLDEIATRDNFYSNFQGSLWVPPASMLRV